MSAPAKGKRRKPKFRVGQKVVAIVEAVIVDTIASGFICCIAGFEFPCHVEQLRPLKKKR